MQGCANETWGYWQADWANPTAPWAFHSVTRRYPFKDNCCGWLHGLGAGDVNGDGKLDLLERSGVWIQPANGGTTAPWPTFYNIAFSIPEFLGTPPDIGGSNMYAYDVDGDGMNDVVSSSNSHGYGLAWFKQGPAGKFTRKMIMNTPAEMAMYNNVAFSQLHSLWLMDMDGDGLKDIVTGKTFLAHPFTTGDAGGAGSGGVGTEPTVLYVFKLIRTPTVHWEPHLIDIDKPTEKASGVAREFHVQRHEQGRHPGHHHRVQAGPLRLSWQTVVTNVRAVLIRGRRALCVGNLVRPEEGRAQTSGALRVRPRWKVRSDNEKIRELELEVRSAVCRGAWRLVDGVKHRGAEVVLHDGDGWRFFSTGRAEGHYQLIQGDGDPHNLNNKLVGGQIQNSSQDQNNKLFDSRIRSGFVGTQIGFGVSTNLTETLEAKAFIGLWLNGIDSHKGNPPYGKSIDAREGWGSLTGPIGTFLFGRTFSVFGSASGEVNAYAYEFAVGNPCLAEAETIACGSVGAGPIYAAPNAQFRYISPRLAGLQLQLALADPSSTPDYQITNYPRVEAEIGYQLQIGENGKVIVKGQGFTQQLAKVNV